MKKIDEYQGKKVLVMGFGISGINAAHLLVKLGANVTANDKVTPKNNDIVDDLEADGIKVITGDNPISLANEGFDVVVKNPGIPYDNPLVAAFVKQGTPIITEAELGWQIFDGHLVSVTGSNGKTTTTTLTQLMIAENAKHQVKYAGNIGISFSKIAEDLGPDDTLVTELSSFQLLGAPTIHPHIAIITNIFSNHLDYHKTRENYINAKLNITRNQTKDDFLVINWDRDEWQKIAQRSQATIVPFSRLNKSHEGSYVEDGMIYWRGQEVMPTKDIRLIGPQNVENALAETIRREYPDCEVLMGTSTAGIAHAAITAHLMGLPMGYVRSGAKDHGRNNQIEGKLEKGQKVVVVEDLISTGGSVLEVVNVLREAGADVLGVVSIFTYGMKKGLERMAEANVKNISLSDFDAVAEVAAREGYIKEADIARLMAFRNNPNDESWRG